MNHRVLGSEIEYQQATKRLEELTDAEPNTPQAWERKELITMLVTFEIEIKKLKQRK